MKLQSDALVVFSGGQDSATCLAWALEKFARVFTLGFTYGQRHAVEMQCRLVLRDTFSACNARWKARLAADHILDIDIFRHLANTALTSAQPIVADNSGLPNTFVPGRNLLFASFAAAYAYNQGIQHVIMGVCETDSSGYPDCRDDAIKAMQVALNIGMGSKFIFHTPLMWLNKADTWELARSLGGNALVDIILEHSHTCYLGERGHRYPWGYGCGQCPACLLRAHGYDVYAQRAHAKD